MPDSRRVRPGFELRLRQEVVLSVLIFAQPTVVSTELGSSPSDRRNLKWTKGECCSFLLWSTQFWSSFHGSSVVTVRATTPDAELTIETRTQVRTLPWETK